MVRRCSDLQRDALIAAGVKPSRLYEDEASGKKDDRPGLNACSSLCVRATRWSSGSSTVAMVGLLAPRTGVELAIRVPPGCVAPGASSPSRAPPGCACSTSRGAGARNPASTSDCGFDNPYANLMF
jgi:hypothetical protein